MEELPPPPPPVEPPVESAWERGLRHAKEVNTNAASLGNHIERVPIGTGVTSVCLTTLQTKLKTSQIAGFAVLLLLLYYQVFLLPLIK